MFKVAVSHSNDSDSEAAIAEIIEQNCQTIEQLKQALGRNFPIFGGCAADSWKFHQTHQFYQNKSLSDSIVILLFAGELQFSHRIASGWKSIGEKGCVTKTQERQVCEIDDSY